MIEVRFTATVFNPDTEETFHGWVSPDWSMTTLYTERDDVKAYTFETQLDAVEFAYSHIGTLDGFDGVTGYAADSRMDLETGENWSYAAHFTTV
jgi:hypothetical protein